MKIVKKYCLALLPDWDHSCTSKTFMILFAIWQWRRKTKQSTYLTFETNQLNGGLCRGEVKGEGGDQSVKTNFKLLIGLNFSPADIIYLPPNRVLAKDPLLWTIAFATVSLPFSPFVLWLRQSHDTQLSIFWGRGRLGVARFIHSNQDKGLHSEKKFTVSKCANQNHVGFSFF